ncbi:tyrosine-type recombinase/integrase [Pseudomonas sp.]|uniref:tyrosine-type recombinase/integrase n=1 Tax=Pseudomonas sp. TaxID=306 RepID=UPI003D6EC315
MRVPIYPEDLLPQAAFRKLAKSIQNRWPGKSPIQLSLASETLSRGLGYADYHELRNASVVCPLDAGAPSESAVRTQITAAISSVLALANDSSVPRSVLEPFVETLPLKALRTFKGTASRGVQVQASKHPTPDFNQADTCNVNTPCPESQIPSYASPAIQQKRPRLHASPLRSEVLTHIDAIKQVVENSGNLRDQSLFALLEMGLRGQVILDTKVSQVAIRDTPMPSSVEMTVEITKAKSPLPLGNTAVIARYISTENLSADDYLFPSDDRTQPISAAQLLQTFQSWERRAQLPSKKLTPNSLRAVFFGTTPAFRFHGYPGFEQIADQLGHSSIYMTEQYAPLNATGTDAILNTKKRRT